MIVFFLELKLSILFPVKCAPGTYSPSGVEPCKPCEKGSYQAEEGKLSCYLARGKSQPMVQALRAKYIVWVSFIYISGFL